MKKLIMMMLTGGLVIGLVCSFRSPEKHPEVTVTPAKLQLFVNQQTDPYTIRVDYTVHIPANYVRRCERLIFQPYFVAPGKEYRLSPLVIEGKEFRRREKHPEGPGNRSAGETGLLRLVSKGEGMNVRLSAVVPFQLWMTQARFRAEVALESCGRKKDLYDLTLADGVIYMPMGPGPVRVEYQKERVPVEKVYTANLFYPEGQAYFDPAYARNQTQLQQIRLLMDSLRQKPSMKLQKIVITGSSSPLGARNVNERLAGQRAEQMKRYLIQHFAVADNQIEVKVEGEDWTGLREAIEHSSLSDKQAVRNILDSSGTDTQKESRLQQLPDYSYLRQYIFPELRKVSCRFYYTQEEEVTRIKPL